MHRTDPHETTGTSCASSYASYCGFYFEQKVKQAAAAAQGAADAGAKWPGPRWLFQQAAITCHAWEDGLCRVAQGLPCRRIPVLPSYDAASRILKVGDCVVRKFSKDCDQTEILDAFEKQHWPPRIEICLGGDPALAPENKLRDLIRLLNRVQMLNLIHFSSDGTGAGACWEFVA